jgi:hypothetical protein
MSTAQPEAPTTPTKVLPDIDVDLILAIDEAIPCQVQLVSTGSRECPSCATFLVVFKKKCDHGGVLLPGDPMLCGTHAAWVASGEYHCGACQCYVAKVGGWQHLVIEFKEL